MANDSRFNESMSPQQKTNENGSIGGKKSEYLHQNSCCQHHHYKNAQQYAQYLRAWLWQYQNAIVMQNMIHNLAATSILHHNYTPANILSQNSFDPNVINRTQAGLATATSNTPQAQAQEGVTFKVPTFWKRIIAELIDFTFLFYIKMTVSFVIMAEFSFDKLQVASVHRTLDGHPQPSAACGEDSIKLPGDIIENFSDLDYEKAFAITFEVIALEVLNRIMITFFETLCLYRPPERGGAGATPGKRLLGLKVVSCDRVQTLGQGQVLVFPAGQISFKNALIRSALKNFTIAFFLPVCLTLFFFKHNRAAYDIIAHTIVVEDP